MLRKRRQKVPVRKAIKSKIIGFKIDEWLEYKFKPVHDQTKTIKKAFKKAFFSFKILYALF